MDSVSEDLNSSFFTNIQNNEITQIRKVFRNIDQKPWEYLETGGFTGIYTY